MSVPSDTTLQKYVRASSMSYLISILCMNVPRLLIHREGHAVIGYRQGSFYLKNQGPAHCAAIRIGSEPGLRDWPLDLGATFSAGNSILVVKE